MPTITLAKKATKAKIADTKAELKIVKQQERALLKAWKLADRALTKAVRRTSTVEARLSKLQFS
jgi:hypothetical protein